MGRLSRYPAGKPYYHARDQLVLYLRCRLDRRRSGRSFHGHLPCIHHTGCSGTIACLCHYHKGYKSRRSIDQTHGRNCGTIMQAPRQSNIDCIWLVSRSSSWRRGERIVLHSRPAVWGLQYYWFRCFLTTRLSFWRMRLQEHAYCSNFVLDYDKSDMSGTPGTIHT